MRVHVLAFILSFSIGICVMLCLVPKPAVVIKFPRPGTENHVYRGAAGDCFKIAARRVPCGSSAADVVPQPIVENDASAEPGLEFRNPLAKQD